MKDQKFTKRELVDNSSFVRWVTGQADAKEAKQCDLWIEQSAENRDIALQAQQTITGISIDASILPNKEADWKHIKEQILAKHKAENSWQPKKRTRDSLGIFLKVAAVLLIGVVSGGIALYVQQNTEEIDKQSIAVHTVSTEFSEKKTISLSDGSEIILASGSVLSYKENWLQQPIQRVTLQKGEAFFSIQPDENGNPGIPRFEVETEDGTTSVMGTRFTVSTYGSGTQVVLEEGEVRVTVSRLDERVPFTRILAPGEMASWEKDQSGIEMREVNPRVYTSWTSNQLFFDDTPLSNLVHRIEKTYGVNVEIADAELLEMKLSGAVDFHSLDALMGAVSDVLNISINQINDTVIIKKTSS